MGFLNNLFDPGGFFGGDKGDIAGGFLGTNLIGDIGDAFGITGLSDAGEDASNYFDDLGDTNEYLAQSRRKNWMNNDGFKRSAQTGFSGWEGSPIGTKFTNEVFGQDDDAIWDMYGGFRNQDYQYAENNGQDTANKRGLHQVGAGIGEGFINTFTGGLGTTLIDGLNNWGEGNSNDDLWKKAAGNYLGNQYGGNIGASNVTGNALGNQVLGGMAGGGISAGVQGDSIKEGSLQGGLNQAIKGGGQMAFDGLNGMFDDEELFGPGNTGTLGGTVDDAYGERSSYGQPLNANQNDANIQANQGNWLPGNSQLQTNESLSMKPQSLSSPVQAYIQAIQGGQGGGGQGGGGYGDLAASLFGAYNAFNQRKQLKDQQRQLQQLFSPDSPYAQQARQRIERKDAAGGRRSQYGPREAQIAALLADRQAQTFPQQQRYQQGIGALDNSFINNLLRGGQQAYRQAPSIGNDMETGLNWLMNFRGQQ
jgi:hypothetical protein